jgi:hypothetical protein
VVIESWRRHFNEVRPHSSLGYLTPATFAARLKAEDPATVEIQAVPSSQKTGPKKQGRSHSFRDSHDAHLWFVSDYD